jgi:serine kinase of HPr protein (carbohydrate metabolism regulator)
VADAGVLIRGPSGAGKSSLAMALVERAQSQGLFSRLVADDRVRIEAAGGRLIASPPAALAGLVERRGVGVLPVPHLAAVVLRLIVELDAAAPRMPGAERHQTVVIAGVATPLIALHPEGSDHPSVVLHALRTWFCLGACGASTLAFAPQHEKMILSAPHAPSSWSCRDGVARGGQDVERNEFCAETV